MEKTFILETKLETVTTKSWRSKRKLKLDKVALLKKALLIVAFSFLLYTLYQAITTTIFVSHFSSVITRLHHFIKSSQPDLQLSLFLFQEVAGSVGSYLRLVGAIFALNCALLFFKKDPKYLEKLAKVFLFESLYFLLLFPAAINHLVGSVISSSEFLNFYTGVSCLLQTVLLFPALFILSRKLKNTQDLASTLKVAGVIAPLYVVGFWVRHGLLWVYAILPLETQRWSLFGTVGFANSLLTLLAAAVVCTIVCFTYRRKRKLYIFFAGTAITLVGFYFAIYDLVSVWDPIYRAYLPLTDFWMITLLVVGVVVQVDSRSSV
jgi:hypothetical protein